MKRRYAWPEGHWNWPVSLTHKHGVRCGEMIWVGGQVDLTPRGGVRHEGDIETQTSNVVDNIARVLEELDCGLEDLVNLNCFYVNDGATGEAAFLARVRDRLPPATWTALSAIPVPYLAYEGMMVEIEAMAMRRDNGDTTSRTHVRHGRHVPSKAGFCEGIRSGKMIFVSAQGPYDENGNVVHKGDIVAQTEKVMARIEGVLAELGAGLGDVVKINRWYAGDVGIDDFEPAALACAAHFQEPGPSATGIPLPQHADPDVLIKIAVVAMLGEDGEHLERTHVWPESLWDWHVHLPYKHGLKCEEMIFLGGQVSLDKRGRALHPYDLPAQTHRAMGHIGTILRELGADYDDVCKVLALYKGDCGARDIHANLPIRSSYFSDPGPATTGVPLPALAYPSMVIEIDIYAMSDRAA